MIETDDRALCTAYAETRSLRRVAAQFGLSRMTVLRRLRSAGPDKWDNAAHIILDGIAPTFRACFVGTCERQAYGNSPYCKMHSLRSQRHGDPNIVLRRGRKRS